MSDTGIQTVPYLTFNCTNRSPSDWEDTLLIATRLVLLHPILAPASTQLASPLCSSPFRKPDRYEFPEYFAHIAPKSVEARVGFDLRQFMLVSRLAPPIAVNYLYGRNQAPGHTDPLPSSTSITTTSFRSITCVTRPTCSRKFSHGILGLEVGKQPISLFYLQVYLVGWYSRSGELPCRNFVGPPESRNPRPFYSS
ncbi:uncharacterized protein N7469_009361 [Penicillium citrinum]|uniref:Uncharacterized protein n=1 Tax=Penicillium citrinum TaxID=5077 RepID=A0A9W9NNI8_PENCI|nr:uncharacterized protein N7469_009361 [Penicillium citrinum]KAJ5223121.1 hypothetical protein N7469_009361 [Penicillium citrinum]